MTAFLTGNFAMSFNLTRLFNRRALVAALFMAAAPLAAPAMAQTPPQQTDATPDISTIHKAIIDIDNGNETGFDTLRTHSTHPDITIRHTVLSALASVSRRSEQAAQTALHIINQMTTDPDGPTRFFAIDNMAQIASYDVALANTAAAMLEEIMQHSIHNHMRIEARSVLINIGIQYAQHTDRAMQLLTERTQSTKSSERGAAVYRLLDITETQPAHKTQAIELLSDMLPREPEFFIRTDIALGIFNAAPGDRAYDEAVLKAARFILGTSNNDFSQNAYVYRSLVTLGRENSAYTEDVIDIFIAQAQLPAAPIRAYIPLHLVDIAKIQPGHEARIVDFLIAQTQSTDSDKRNDALFPLAQMAVLYPAQADRAFDTLLGHINDNTTFVRYNVVDSMVYMAIRNHQYTARTINSLTALETDPMPHIRGRAAALMGKIGAAIPQQRETAFAFIQKLQEQPIYESQTGAMQGYSHLATVNIDTARRVLPLLMPFTSPLTSDKHVRADLPEALVEIMSTYPEMAVEGLDILAILQQDIESIVRESADRAYEQHQKIIRQRIEHDHLLVRAKLETDLPNALKDETQGRIMLPLAINLATTTDILSRRKAVEIIGQLGRAHNILAPDSIAALTSLNNDRDSGVRLAIVQALARSGLAHEAVATGALDALRPLTTDSEPMVSGLARSAVEALGTRNPDLADEAALILRPLELKQPHKIKTPQP
ncbi:MAG: HEAT repeat domain-containing protein [Alphaproteobacteria bacterium]|nr:HEAT repeat domain-containing protein [Alphaproteobacteria bacterium]